MTRLRAETSEPFTEWLGRPRRALAEATRAGVEAAAEGLKLDLRQALAAGGVSDRLGRAIGSAVFPRGRGSLGAAGTVFARGENADRVLTAFARGATIRAKGGRYLTIPTGFNLVDGRRGARVLVTARQMAAAKGLTFVQRSKGGALLWWLRVEKSSRVRQLKDGSFVRQGITDARVGSLGNASAPGRLIRDRKRRELAVRFGAVPMFVLISEVTIARKFDPDTLARVWADRIPDLIERALPRDL